MQRRECSELHAGLGAAREIARGDCADVDGFSTYAGLHQARSCVETRCGHPGHRCYVFSDSMRACEAMVGHSFVAMDRFWGNRDLLLAMVANSAAIWKAVRRDLDGPSSLHQAQVHQSVCVDFGLNILLFPKGSLHNSDTTSCKDCIATSWLWSCWD